VLRNCDAPAGFGQGQEASGGRKERVISRFIRVLNLAKRTAGGREFHGLNLSPSGDDQEPEKVHNLNP
jgi:hypothetical protein